ncbi:MAG: SidA/IucD/PvdA family monooxygenase [Actinomycetota bacterium]|nr:SidA/IucD/PvdA family monooxygenase [Actinomycetota bacterium]
MTLDRGVRDLVCVGFGPAGIALAAAIDDAQERGDPAGDLESLFLDRARDSAWQPNMLLPGTDIQHHFLRDFATPRDPRSRFTFANYLKENGRLFPFCLFGSRVSRVEWSDYVQWVARRVRVPVAYRHEVTAVEPVSENGSVTTLRVAVRDVDRDLATQVLTRNVVVATGYVPHVPRELRGSLGPTVFHSHDFLARISRFRPEESPSFAVVGAGQNAGEILLYLIDRFPDSAIHSVVRNSGFRLYDLGHFSNQVYFPEETDYVYGLSKDERARVFEETRLTNYSSIDADVSEALYLRAYEERLLGRDRIHMLRRTGVTGIRPAEGRHRLLLEDVHTHRAATVDVDAVVLCTGFTEPRCPRLVSPLLPYLRTDADGDLEISRYYRVAAKPRFRAGIYLNGITEWVHGISNATSFSMMALKAQEILDDVHRHRSAAPPEPVEALVGSGFSERKREESDAR